jgi:hypothetical protein
MISPRASPATIRGTSFIKLSGKRAERFLSDRRYARESC